MLFSALVIGSLAPDFPYFLFVSNEIRWGHTSRGIFLFCLPMALAVLWLFHAVAKKPIVALSPEFVRKRISARDLQFRFGPKRRFAWIVISILIGIISHVLWDGFTHDHGYFVKHWPLLSIPVETYRVMPLWRALQQVFSVFGVAIVAIVTISWWRRKALLLEPVRPEMTPRLRWFVIAIMVLLAFMVGAAAGYRIHYGHQWKMSLIEGTIVTISTLSAEVLAFSLVWLWQGSPSEEPVEREVQPLQETARH